MEGRGEARRIGQKRGTVKVQVCHKEGGERPLRRAAMGRSEERKRDSPIDGRAKDVADTADCAWDWAWGS
jgi:hypothetical protein